MTTRQTTIRLPERTDEQLAELASLFGDRTKAITIAVDRLYRAEVAPWTEGTDDDHPSAIDVQWYIYAKKHGNCLACYVRPAADGDLCPRCAAETQEED